MEIGSPVGCVPAIDRKLTLQVTFARIDKTSIAKPTSRNLNGHELTMASPSYTADASCVHRTVMGQSARTPTNCIRLASSSDGQRQAPQVPSSGRVLLPGFLCGPFSIDNPYLQRIPPMKKFISIAVLASCCLFGLWFVSSSGAFETADDQDKTQPSSIPNYVKATFQQMVGEWSDGEQTIAITMRWLPDGNT